MRYQARQGGPPILVSYVKEHVGWVDTTGLGHWVVPEGMLGQSRHSSLCHFAQRPARTANRFPNLPSGDLLPMERPPPERGTGA